MAFEHMIKNIYIGEYEFATKYQEVEYIQSSGTQYIDTGYIPSNNTKIEMSMGSWVSNASYPSLFGARYAWSSSGRGFLIGDDTSNSNEFIQFNEAIVATNLTFTDGGATTIVMSQSGLYENGNLRTTFSTVTFTSPGNLYFFNANDNGALSDFAVFKLYYCKLRDNGTLVRDFVPCYRKSDGIIGLYDLVNDTFYTNSGSGTFTKGPDVN